MTNSTPEDDPSGSSTQSHTILLVEDNPGDARLIREAFSAPAADGLRVVQTGEAALDFVTQQGKYADAPHPDLILLDWYLPEMDGQDVLTELTSDPENNHIPVIVLTGSQSERDVRISYKQNANACIIKDTDPDEFAATLRALEDFWLSSARLPGVDEEA